MPRAAVGRIVEGAGFVACLGGLVAAFALTVSNGPIAAMFDRLFKAFAGTTDTTFTATMTGLICLLPGLALLGTGRRLAGAAALSPGAMSALMAPRRTTSGRMLAVLVCLLIAVLCLVAAVTLWPDVAALME